MAILVPWRIPTCGPRVRNAVGPDLVGYLEHFNVEFVVEPVGRLEFTVFHERFDKVQWSFRRLQDLLRLIFSDSSFDDLPDRCLNRF